jgi:molybdenum cofactor cytidylyltransferase
VSAASHAAILLAAGASRRLGRPKALLEIDGEPLVRRSARALLASAPHALWVVTGDPVVGGRIAAALNDLPARCIVCADWASGMAASLRTGVQAAAADAIDGVLACPVDLPELTAIRLRELIALWHQAPARPAACRYGGRVGTPAVLPRTAFAAVAALQGDRGARDWLRAHPDLAVLDAPELARDIDRPEDLEPRPRHRAARRQDA